MAEKGPPIGPSAETIAAQSTPVGEGAIGVVRLSGPESKKILSTIFKGKTGPDAFESHRLYLGNIVHPETGEALDQVMAVWMAAPHSYTGEEMAEIQAHGSAYLLCRILEAIIAQGARLAEPGEFTKRAYLNGKMDLSQAEAVCDLIHAQNEWAAKNALSQLGGYLSRTVGRLRDSLLELCANVEAGFDFSEEDIHFFKREDALKLVGGVKREVEALLDSFETGQLYKQGLTVALIGRPNVGKSSLLNALLNEDKSIIHDEPGTTRDVISGERKINGIQVHFFDTAGIREASGAVEQEGIRRSKVVLEKADLCLLLLDSSRALTVEDEALVALLQDRPHLILSSKADLPAAWTPPSSYLAISAKKKEGVSELLSKINELALKKGLNRDRNYVLNNVRHRDSLAQVRIMLENVQTQLQEDRLLEECFAEELRGVIRQLSMITGDIDSEQVLDEIFAKFCIGK